MKAVAGNKKHETDFYLENLAPLNRQQGAPLRYLDMVLLTVLFMEIGGLVRLMLAE